MKKLSKILLLTGVISILLFGLNSCEPEDNNPTDTDVRSKYVASWTCAEQGGMSYPVTITLDPSNSTQVLIGNFHFLGANEKTRAIATSNNITIPSQELCGNTINGSGTLNNANKITLVYYVNDHSNTVTVNATYTK